MRLDNLGEKTSYHREMSGWGKCGSGSSLLTETDKQIAAVGSFCTRATGPAVRSHSSGSSLSLSFPLFLFHRSLPPSLPPLLFPRQICASVISDICIDAAAGRGFLEVASEQPKCAVQEKVLLAYRVLRRPIHIILKQLESRTSIPVSHCSLWENG